MCGVLGLICMLILLMNDVTRKKERKIYKKSDEEAHIAYNDDYDSEEEGLLIAITCDGNPMCEL